MKVHIICQSTLSFFTAGAAWAHFISPEVEAAALCIAGLACVWGQDFERYVRHRHYVAPKPHEIATWEGMN